MSVTTRAVERRTATVTRTRRVSVGTFVAALTALILAGGAALAVSPHVSAPRCAPLSHEPQNAGSTRPNPLARTVAAIRLCRYRRNGTLRASRLVTAAATVRSLVRALNALPAVPQGTIACPTDDGSSMLIYAAARHRPPRVINAALSGCAEFAGLGDIRWDVPSGDRLVARLKRLVP